MRDRAARVAGFLYLIAVVGGFYGLRYLPDKIVKPGDAVATAQNIAAHEMLLRLAIVSDIVGGAIWLFVVLALYQVLKDVDRVQAQLMVILGAFMQVPIYFVNAVNYAGALMLVRGGSFLSAFSDAQRAALAMVFLKLHNYELLSSLFLAGIWLFPFGVLVYKSGFLPRTLGVWLAINGVAWVVTCLGDLLTPQYGDLIDRVTAPILLGEIVTMLWLLIVGARTIPARRSVPDQ